MASPPPELLALVYDFLSKYKKSQYSFKTEAKLNNNGRVGNNNIRTISLEDLYDNYTLLRGSIEVNGNGNNKPSQKEQSSSSSDETASSDSSSDNDDNAKKTVEATNKTVAQSSKNKNEKPTVQTVQISTPKAQSTVKISTPKTQPVTVAQSPNNKNGTPISQSSTPKAQPVTVAQSPNNKNGTPTAQISTPTDNEKKRKAEEVTTDSPNTKIQRSNQSGGVRFQRIDVSKTKFSNKKLADNSFASNSHQYGAKAAEDLSKVKGDRFKHEKTKKKRGSYKGKISLAINSIPFDSSEEEDTLK